MKSGRGLTIARMVELVGVSRASFYRYDEDAAVRPDRDMDLRDAIQRIALEWPSYGSAADHGRPSPGGVGGQSQTGLPIAS
jgi:hypothetical protein